MIRKIVSWCREKAASSIPELMEVRRAARKCFLGAHRLHRTQASGIELRDNARRGTERRLLKFAPEPSGALSGGQGEQSYERPKTLDDIIK